MRNRFGEICRWQADPAAEVSLDSLQVILHCASLHGCGDCVSCSDRALGLFLDAARAFGRMEGVLEGHNP